MRPKPHPNYDVHPKTRVGELREDYVHFDDTDIKGFLVSEHSHIQLDPEGRMRLLEGYVWDFGSGPAIDTPDMVVASLAHDAFYECMVLGLLPWSVRKSADKYFKKLLKAAGMGWFRRQWVYAGVRYGYPITKALGFMGRKKGPQGS